MSGRLAEHRAVKSAFFPLQLYDRLNPRSERDC